MRQEAKRARDEARRERQQTWQERVRSDVERLEQRLESLYDALARREAHLQILQAQRDSAWSEGFRARVEGWIDEKEERIQDIRAKIRTVEARLD